MGIQKHFALLVASLAIAGSVCADQSSPLTRIPDPDEALALQRKLNSPQELDMSRISVARIRLDGHPLEVTSLIPVVVSESKVGNRPALTVFRFSEDKSALILFTRNGRNGEGYRRDLAREEWTDGRVLQFPVVNDDGTVATKSLELVKVLER